MRVKRAYARIAGSWIAVLISLPAFTFAGDLADPNQPEQAKNILADQIREQGHVCDTAIEAHHDEAVSKPDEPVWILRCSNASYRIRVRADMSAYVEPIADAP
jgi:hypothetical protein